MTGYLLDTNVCINLMRGTSPRLTGRIKQIDANQLSMSSITLAELMYGAAKSSRLSYHQELICGLCSTIDVLPFSAATAVEYGTIRCALESQGRPIGHLDQLIATHAIALGYVLVTNNVREFRRVPQLRVENWLLPP